MKGTIGIVNILLLSVAFADHLESTTPAQPVNASNPIPQPETTPWPTHSPGNGSGGNPTPQPANGSNPSPQPETTPWGNHSSGNVNDSNPIPQPEATPWPTHSPGNGSGGNPTPQPGVDEYTTNPYPEPYTTYPTTSSNTTNPFTPPLPTTIPRNITFPEGSSLGDAFKRVILNQSEIANNFYNFHYYEYSSYNNFEIPDGGNDMYDGGNKVYFSSDSIYRRAEYNVYYSEPELYEFASVTGWPFVALMYINNTYYHSYAYSIQVKSDAGADGSGNLIYFSNSGVSATGNVSVAYFVTQVYNANDPTICEVFFVLSEGEPIDVNSFVAVRNSHNTNTLDSTARLNGYPKDIWLGYMLLSRKNGQYINRYEVEYALNILAGSVLNYEVFFFFQIPSTQTPTTPTTTGYIRYVYEGIRVSICNNYRFFSQNYTSCESNMTASLLQFTAVVPTPLGFNVPLQIAISGCTDNESCRNGCSNVQNIVGNASTSQCRASCCSYSYCNYPYNYYSYTTDATLPTNITIPQSLLPNVSVEILPNCFFKQMFPRMVTCVSEVFNSWPFSSTDQCKSSLLTAIQCNIDILESCRNSDLLTTALTRIPPEFDFATITPSILQLGVLELLCEVPAVHLPFANFTSYGPYNSSFSFPVFPSSIGIGEPFCDNFILDSLISWSIEYLTVLKTARDRYSMCSSLKGFVNKIVNAVENRCDFEHLIAAFPCDFLTRNQLRALIVQAKEMLPQVVPDYCDGVEPPTEPERPDDIPLLPSCSLRQTINSVWTCEKIFTSSAPYSDSDVCKTNINRLLQCVANQLQACGTGDGYNVFDNLYPGFTFDAVIEAIRSSARTPSRGSYYGSYRYYGRNNFLDNFCSGATIYVPNFEGILGTVFGVCKGNLTGEISDQITQAYYKYAGARNAADVCTAFRSLRDWFHNAAEEECDFSLFQYYVPLQSPIRNSVSHGINILIDVLPELEISVCPKIPTNQTSVSADWLKSYVRWRSHSLPKWQAAFAKWRSETGTDVTVEIPGCLDLTGIICQNCGMKTCVSDYYKCSICYCLDSKYKNLAGIVMTPWLEDYESWQNFMATWEDKFEEGEHESDC